MEQQQIQLKKFGAVVVDMQPGFLRSVSSRDRKNLFTSQKKVLEVCVEENYPIIALEFSPELKGNTSKEIMKIIKNASRYKTFEKETIDGFYNIKEQLDEWGMEELCFMGIYASRCVRKTASSAILERKKIFTAKELIASPELMNNELEKRESKNNSWFQENGVYHRNYTDLIDHITSSN